MRRYLGPRCVECYLLFVTLISPGPCDLCYKIQKQSFCSLISYKKPKSFLNAILTLKIAKSFLIYKKLLAKNSHLRNFSGHLTQGSYLLKKQKFSRNFFYLEYLTGQKNALGRGHASWNPIPTHRCTVALCNEIKITNVIT